MVWTFIGLCIIFPFWLIGKVMEARNDRRKDEWMERRFQLARQHEKEGMPPCKADDLAWKETTEELGPWGQFFGLR